VYTSLLCLPVYPRVWGKGTKEASTLQKRENKVDKCAGFWEVSERFKPGFTLGRRRSLCAERKPFSLRFVVSWGLMLIMGLPWALDGPSAQSWYSRVNFSRKDSYSRFLTERGEQAALGPWAGGRGARVRVNVVVPACWVVRNRVNSRQKGAQTPVFPLWSELFPSGECYSCPAVSMLLILTHLGECRCYMGIMNLFDTLIPVLKV